MRLVLAILYLACQTFEQLQLHGLPFQNQPPQMTPIQGKQMVTNGAGWQNCPCAVSFKCPTCGPAGYESQQNPCPCMPQPSCPNCIMGKILKQYHEKSAELAKKDAVTQNKLALESMLEKKLFQTAEKYAQEAAAEEKLAKESVVQLQEHASKAALARSKMIRAENQAKQVAVKALQTLTTQSSQVLGKNFPQFMLTQTGVRQVAITQNTPEYQINVGVGAGDGYMDSINQEISNQVQDQLPSNRLASSIAQEQPLIPSQLQSLVQGPNTVQGQAIVQK